jgi:flagellar biosynthetic protein FliR
MIVAGLLLFVRIAALFTTAPLVSDLAPMRIRAAMALAIALALAPLRPPAELTTLWVSAPLELALGLATSLVARLVFAGVEAGGQMMGHQLSLGFAGTMDIHAREEVLPTRRLAWTLGGIAFLASGGLESWVRAILIAPPATHFSVAAVGPHIIDAAARVMPAALHLSAPLLLSGLIANLAVAIASRAAPSLQVFSVMLSVTLTLGAVVLLAASPGISANLLRQARLTANSVGVTLSAVQQ